MQSLLVVGVYAGRFSGAPGGPQGWGSPLEIPTDSECERVRVLAPYCRFLRGEPSASTNCGRRRAVANVA